jgi:dienelactone hydrolase
VIEQYDYSRIFQPALDDLGKPYQGERARPLQTLIWYPAQRVARKAMTFGEYKKLAETETTFGAPRLLTGWFIDGTKSALRSTLWSVRDAPAESGRFPLVIYAPSFSSWAWENADLCEYLASYGYIVIASPGMGVRRTSTHDVLGTDAQSRDILFLLAYARSLSNADVRQMAVVGFSWGGLSALFAAARDDRIKALVALDGSMRYFPGLVKQAGDVDPEAMTVPLLYFKAQFSLEEKAKFDAVAKDQKDRDKIEGPDVLLEWTHGDLISVQMLGLVHPEFNPLSQRDEYFWKYDFAQTQEGDYGRQDGAVGYAWVARYTREFLDAYLKGDAQALKFLKNRPSENGVPEHVMGVDFRAAQPIPFSFNSFQVEVSRQGFGHVAEIYANTRKEHPDFKLDVQLLQSWGYGLLASRHFSESIEIMKLEAQAAPSSSAFFDLAEAYTASGQMQLAIEYYGRALAEDPANRGATERLREYGRSPSD